MIKEKSGKNCIKRKKSGSWEADDCSHNHEYVCDSSGSGCTSVVHTCAVGHTCTTANGNYQCDSICKEGYIYEDGNCIEFSGSQQCISTGSCGTDLKWGTWQEGFNACNGQGGSLPTPRSQLDLDYLATIDGDIWIGVKRTAGVWKYTDNGESKSYFGHCKREREYNAVSLFLVCSIIICVSKLLLNKQGIMQLDRAPVLACCILVIRQS